MTQFISIALLFLPSLTSAALQTNQTLTPSAGQHDLRVGARSLAADARIETETLGTTTVKSQGYGLDAKYHYGLSDDHSFGLELGYRNQKEETESTFGDSTYRVQGLEGTTLRYQGKKALETPHLYWSVAYTLGFEDSRIDDDAETANVSPAQDTLSLKGGVLLPVTSGVFGVLLEYQSAQDGREQQISFGETETYRIKKGGALNAEIFAELDHPFHPSLSLLHQRRYNSEETDEAGTGTTNMGYTEIGVRLMARYQTAEQTELIPSVTLMKLQETDSTEDVISQKIDTTTIGLLARFLF